MQDIKSLQERIDVLRRQHDDVVNAQLKFTALPASGTHLGTHVLSGLDNTLLRIWRQDSTSINPDLFANHNISPDTRETKQPVSDDERELSGTDDTFDIMFQNLEDNPSRILQLARTIEDSLASNLDPLPLLLENQELAASSVQIDRLSSQRPAPGNPLSDNAMKPTWTFLDEPLTTRQCTDSDRHSWSYESLNPTNGEKSSCVAHQEGWGEKLRALLEFKKTFGHCCVPSTVNNDQCSSLARWVKRQRHQYKLKINGKASYMTNERIKLLEDCGFVWDSHHAAFQTRLLELYLFKARHGHTRVPGTYAANTKLATWCKYQRQQYRLFRQGKPSNLSLDRALDLERVGFEWRIARRAV